MMPSNEALSVVRSYLLHAIWSWRGPILLGLPNPDGERPKHRWIPETSETLSVLAEGEAQNLQACLDWIKRLRRTGSIALGDAQAESKGRREPAQALVEKMVLPGSGLAVLVGMDESGREKSKSAGDARKRQFQQAARDILETFKAFHARGEVKDMAQDHQEATRRVQDICQALLGQPDGPVAFLDRFTCPQGVQAIAHFEVRCDSPDAPELREAWFATPKSGGDGLALAPGAKARQLALNGFLLEGWRSARSEAATRQVRTSSLLGRKNDPLTKYLLERVDAESLKDRYVLVGYTSRRVPSGVCDLEPHCRHQSSCCLLAKSEAGADSGQTPSEGKTWNRRRSLQGGVRRWSGRLCAVDLILAPVEADAYLTTLQLIRVGSLLGQMRKEEAKLEATLLRAMNHLPEGEKRSYLRYLFEECRAMEDPQEKGAAFERFAYGFLRLVPGWITGTRNATDMARTREIDLTVFVEPATLAAAYWHSFWGPKVLVECKNYPEGLGGNRLRSQKGEMSPVVKILRNLRDMDVKLGILLNTGPIENDLKKEAEAVSGKDRLVVLFEERDIRHVIENPEDAEMFFKQKVSDAAIGVTSKRQ